MGNKGIRFFSIAGGLTVCAATTVALLTRTPDGVVRQGVRIAGIDFGGKPADTVREELSAWRDTQLAKTIAIATPKSSPIRRTWNPMCSDLGLDVDVESTLIAALAIGDEETALDRVTALFAGYAPVDIQPKRTVDAAKAAKYLKRTIAPIVRREPVNARFVAGESGFKIIPERNGKALDLDATTQSIRDRAGADAADPLEVAVRTLSPHVSTADLQGIEGEVSRYRTHYSERGNRSRNIVVACDKINGTVLKPGDRFSYNEIVGPRDSDSGFRIAPVIVKGRMVPGMGGGVCQVSTTLYNAVLLADLKIVRREHHAFPVHYASPGRDATVVYGSIDFQFENDTDGPIAVAASGRGQQVFMRIFGKPVPGRQVVIERTNISSWGAGEKVTRDSSLPEGRRVVLDKGHSGHRVTVWRKVKVDGLVTKREAISHDTYRSFPRLVVMGTQPTGPRPPASTAVPSQPATISAPVAPSAGPGAPFSQQ